MSPKRPTRTPRAAPAGPPAATARAHDMVLPALLLVTLAVKGVVLAQLHAHPLLQPAGGLDSEAYVDLGRRIAAGDVLLGPAPYYVAPLYAYFLGLVFALTGGSLLAAKLAQIALGTAAVALVHATARQWGGLLAARAAAVLTAATGLLTFSEVLLLQSALDPFLAALALFLLARALRDEARAGWLATGAGWGLFALNRPNVLVVVAGFALVLVVRAAMRRRLTALVAPAWLLLGTCLILAPTFARNLALSGEPILISSHGGLNFYIGNHAGADGTYRSVAGVTPNISGQAHDAQQVAERAAGRRLSTREASAWYYARAWEWVAAHPVDALRLFGRKLGYVFNSGELTLNFSYAYYVDDEHTWLRGLAVGPGLLLPLGLVGLVWHAWRPRREGFRLWAACVPLYALSVAAFFVAGRYRQPLLLPLAVGAGLAIEQTRDAWREGRRGRLAVVAVGLLAVAAVTNRDLGFDDGRAEERAALVEWLIDQGRADDARRHLDQPGLDDAGRARVLARAGRAWLQRGDPGAAAEQFARAWALAPERAELQLALGQARLAAGDAQGAVEPLRRAFAARVQPALVAFDLARALDGLGRVEEARAVLRELGHGATADSASLLALGELALRLREAASAEAYLRRGLAEAGTPALEAGAREKLGTALSLQGRAAEALTELEHACRLDPRRPGAQLNRAVALAQLGRLGEARAAVGEALRLRPDYPQALGLRRELSRP